MPRIGIVAPDAADGEVKDMYDTLKKKMGRVSNIFQLMGNSPAVLKAYFGLSEAQKASSFSPQLIERIALLVGEKNRCGYCIAAHTAVGKSVGLSEEQTVEARKGTAQEAKEQAVLTFAHALLEKHGWAEDDDIAAAKEAGMDDQEIVETILVVVANIFTNYFNHVTDPEVDFPAPPSL